MSAPDLVPPGLPSAPEHACGALYEHVACPLCGRADSAELYRTHKLTGTFLGRVTVSLAQCAGCGFVFNSPRPTAPTMARYYAEDPLASGRVYRACGAQAYYPRLFAERAAFYASFLERRPCGRLLDVGCGTGGFLRALAARVGSAWELCGLEPSCESHAAAVAEGLTVERGYLGDPLFPDASFDAVSLISVLEHLPDPMVALREVARLLRPDGIALLEVPNTLQPELSLTGWFGLEHVCHFTPGTLARVLRDVGLGELRADVNANRCVLRAVAGRDLAAWGCDRLDTLEPDADRAAAVVARYAATEQAFLAALERRVGGTLERWRQAGRTIAVYGAGAHTAELSAHFDLKAYATCLVDGDPTKQGTLFLGLPVLPPEALAELGIDAVLLSTHRFVDEMTATVRRCAGPDVELERCYDDLSNSNESTSSADSPDGG